MAGKMGRAYNPNLELAKHRISNGTKNQQTKKRG